MPSPKPSAQWLGRRYDAAAPGRSGDRSAGAQRHARGTFSRRARRQELGAAARRPAGGADPQSVLCRLCGRRDRRRLRAGLSAGDRGDRLPARSRCARRRPCWRAPSRSISPRRRTRKARSPIAPISTSSTALARRFGFLIFADECYCEIYSDRRAAGHARSRRARFRQCRRVPLAVEAFEPAGAAHRLCRRRPQFPREPISNCAMSRRRKCRRRCSMSPSPPITTRRMSRKTGGSIARNSISPIRSSATVTAIAVPPADFSSGSMFRRRAAARRRRSCCGARPACASCPAAISRANRPTAAIPAPTISASPWCRTRRSPPRRCIAWSRCLA